MLVYKVMDFEIGRVNQEERSFWAVASTSGPDRQGDVVLAQGWQTESYLKNPVILWAHDHNRPPVARALELKNQTDRLLVKVQFARADDYPFADTVFRLYQGGFMSAFSVGFLPIKSRVIASDQQGVKQTGIEYSRQELLEISCVTLPANPQALAAKGPKQTPFYKNNPDRAHGELKRALLERATDRLIRSRLKSLMGRA